MATWPEWAQYLLPLLGGIAFAYLAWGDWPERVRAYRTCREKKARVSKGETE